MTQLNIIKTPVQLFSKRLTHIKFSQLIIEDLSKIENLNKKSLKESYLLNSYIMNLVASWQIFIEDLAGYAIKKMTSEIQNSNLNIIFSNNLDERIKKFNTPNSDNIDMLFKNIIGIEKITKFLEPVNLRKQINEILNIRHSLAHTGYTSEKLTISGNFERMEILMKAAKKIEEIVINHISK